MRKTFLLALAGLVAGAGLPAALAGPAFRDMTRVARSDPDLWAALSTLDTTTRSALLLNVLDGYTQAEIAGMLGVPEGTVASWLSRGRAALRRELDPDR